MPRFTTKVTAKGQVTIPKVIRDLLQLTEGDYLVLEPDGDRVIASKASLATEGDFDAWADRIAQRFKDQAISKDDVDEAIRCARDRS
jgi:AbrB family looped-hinge helix DNA binding protein